MSRRKVARQQTAERRLQNRVQVVPLSSNTDRLYPSEAYAEVYGKQGKAMADKLTTVSKTRLIDMMGRLSGTDMRKVEQAIRVQLALNP
jgi:mRNA interferase MazF